MGMTTHPYTKKLKSLKIDPKYYRRKSNESREIFVARMARQLGRNIKPLLVLCEGDIALLAYIYNCPEDLIRTVISLPSNIKKLKPLHTKGMATAKLRADKVTADQAMWNAEQAEASRVEKAKLSRKNWPIDAEARREQVREALLVSFLEREGVVADVAEALSLPIWEIQETLDTDAEVAQARERGDMVKAARIERRLSELAETSSNPGAAKTFLQNRSAERWKDKTEHTVRTVGMVPPERKETGGILRLVQNNAKKDGTEDD